MKSGRKIINQKIAHAEGVKQALSVRKEQLRRCCYAISADGTNLVEYLEDVRQSLLTERSLCAPEDSLENAKSCGRLNIVDRVLHDWDNGVRLFERVSKELDETQKELDKLYEL